MKESTETDLDYQNDEVEIKLKANETKIIEEVAPKPQSKEVQVKAKSCRPPTDYKEKRRKGETSWG